MFYDTKQVLYLVFDSASAQSMNQLVHQTDISALYVVVSLNGLLMIVTK